MTSLPDGLRGAPATPDDLDDVLACIVAGELADGHRLTTTVQDLQGEWDRPSMDLATTTLVVRDDDAAVLGYAEALRGRAYVHVHPDALGRGIGTALAAWTEQVARRDGSPRIGQTVIDTATAAHALLRSRGYVARWETWVLRMPLDEEPAAVDPPPGVVVRTGLRPVDDRAVHGVIEAAFSTWRDRDEPSTFEDWRASFLDSRGDDLHLLLAELDGEPVGAAVLSVEEGAEGWVDQLGVRPDRWGRGIAGALLRAAFGHFHSLGLPTVALSTESRTGALGLYEHVGMQVDERFTRLSLRLD